MKKMIITLILSVAFLRGMAPAPPPETKPISIIESEPIYIYGLSDPFAYAIGFYESRLKPHAVNEVSGARGIFQITEVMIKEVNKILSQKEALLSFIGYPMKFQRYTWDDAFDPHKSIEIWYIVQQWKNPDYCYDKACRIWFGTGKQYDGKTWHTYFNEVMALID